MSYRPPEGLEKLLGDLYATPPSVIGEVKRLIPNLQ